MEVKEKSNENKTNKNTGDFHRSSIPLRRSRGLRSTYTIYSINSRSNIHAATLTAGSCGRTVVLDPSLSNYSPVAGTIAELVYACDTSGSAAFTTNGPTYITVSATPTFTVPSGWIMWVDTTAGDCASISQSGLTSGSPIALTGGTGYVYCLYTASASTSSTFSVAWSQ